MDAQKIVRIKSNENHLLEVTLEDVLSLIQAGEKYSWSILWMEAVSKVNMGIQDIEERIKTLEKGLIIDWAELKTLSGSLSQVIEILIIGDPDINNIRKYESDQLMYVNCRYVLELIDSSYWEICSKDVKLLSDILSNFPTATEI